MPHKERTVEDHLFGPTEPERQAGPRTQTPEQKKESVRVQQTRERPPGPLADLPLIDKAALATAPIPGVGDVVGGMADFKAVKDDPSPLNITLAALGLVPFLPSGFRILRGAEETSPRFQKAVEREIGQGANKPVSRDVIVEMDADDFLNVVPATRSERKMKRLREALGERGEDLEELPTLFLDDTGDAIEVFGHEGRHRIRTLQEMGEQKIPVRVSRRMQRGEFRAPDEVVREDQRDIYRISKRMEEEDAGAVISNPSLDNATQTELMDMRREGIITEREFQQAMKGK